MYVLKRMFDAGEVYACHKGGLCVSIERLTGLY